MKKKIKISDTLVYAVCFAIVLIYCLILIAALFWALMSSFKAPLMDFIGNPVSVWPKVWADNYSGALKMLKVSVSGAGMASKFIYMPQMFLNSVIYTILSVSAAIICKSVVAYLCGRYKFFGNKIIYITVWLVMMIPIFGTLPSSIRINRELNIYNTFFSIFIMNFSFDGTYFLVLHTAFAGIPKDYFDAADIDGAGHFGKMWHIGIPMTKTVISAMVVLSAIGAWNNYSTPLVFLPKHPTIAYGLYYIQNNPEGVLPPVQLAAAMMTSIPLVIMFICFRNKIMGNLAIGGLKG